MAERARAAAPKAYETRDRSVRTSDKDVRKLARVHLVDLYTNLDGQMVCQACHQEMPFKLSDGSPYFEAPELLPNTLCRTC